MYRVHMITYQPSVIQTRERYLKSDSTLDYPWWSRREGEMETSTRRRCSVSAAPHCNPHLADLDVAFDSSRMVVKPVPSLALGAYLWSSRTVLFFFYDIKKLGQQLVIRCHCYPSRLSLIGLPQCVGDRAFRTLLSRRYYLEESLCRR